MGERDKIGTGENSLSPEQKEAANQEAISIARDALGKQLISDKHGLLRQEELMSMSDEELLNRFVQIADRGFVSYRLKVPMPPGWHGEWIGNDPQSIAEAHMKGFTIDDKFAIEHGLHSDSTGKPIVGDVIHMICPQRIKDMHDRAAKTRFERNHGRKKHLPEENNFEGNVKGLGLQTAHKGNDINTSSQEIVPGSQILQSIKGT